MKIEFLFRTFFSQVKITAPAGSPTQYQNQPITDFKKKEELHQHIKILVMNLNQTNKQTRNKRLSLLKLMRL